MQVIEDNYTEESDKSIELIDKSGRVAVIVTDEEVQVLDRNYDDDYEAVKFTGAGVGVNRTGVIGDMFYHIGDPGSAKYIAKELCGRTGLKTIKRKGS